MIKFGYVKNKQDISVPAITGNIGNLHFQDLPVKICPGKFITRWQGCSNHKTTYGIILANEYRHESKIGVDGIELAASRLHPGDEIVHISSDVIYSNLCLLLTQEEYEKLKAGEDIEWIPGLNYSFKDVDKDPRFSMGEPEKNPETR